MKPPHIVTLSLLTTPRVDNGWIARLQKHWNTDISSVRIDGVINEWLKVFFKLVLYHIMNFFWFISPLTQHQSFFWNKTLQILNRLYENRWMKQTCEHKYSAYFSSPSWCWPSRGKILKNLKDCQFKISGMPDIKEQHFKSRKRSFVLESFLINTIRLSTRCQKLC